MNNITQLDLVNMKPELEDLYQKIGYQTNFQIKPYSFYKNYSKKVIRTYMHFEAFYTLPTEELIDYLKSQIKGYSAIEISCGNGNIAKSLKIPATDSKLQEREDIKLNYMLMAQPLIKYPDFVEKYEAIDAVRHYNPEIVIGSFVTKRWDGDSGNYWGVHEPDFLPLIKKYIHIGSLEIHSNKPLMKVKHKTIQPDWLIVRGKQGFIGIWDNT